MKSIFSSIKTIRNYQKHKDEFLKGVCVCINIYMYTNKECFKIEQKKP